MKRRILILILALAVAPLIYADTHAAASTSYADVAAAIALASTGDTVSVPAGTATWASQLVITTGINLIGAGIGVTNITSNYSKPAEATLLWGDTYLIAYYPASPESDNAFRISGFTIDCASKCGPLFLYSNSSTPQTKIRVDHIRTISGILYSTLTTLGAIWGVVDNNIFDGCYVSVNGYDINNTLNEWNTRGFNFGSADMLYFEDNTFVGNGDTLAIRSEMGARWCSRHNTYDGTLCTTGLYPWHDMHGNQGGAGWTATMGVEIYENTVTLPVSRQTINILDQRGGKALVYNNTLTTTSGGASTLRDEYLDSIGPGPASNAISGQPQHVSGSYYWSNLINGVTRGDASVTATLDYGGMLGLVPQLNRDAYNQVTSFDGTVGIGVGLLAARPATCTTEVGYWATDTSTLYRAVATNTWEAYYTPYTYPHPLRDEGAAPDVMAVVSPNGGESWAGNSVHNITWTNTGDTVYANVKIEYSTDAGVTWTTIIASTPNTGSYSWTVPNTAGSYLIKISAVV